MHDHLGTAPKPPLLQIAPAPMLKAHDHHTEFMVGLDVGSTTVKAIVVDAASDQVLWQDYQRHETKQPEKSLEFLRRVSRRRSSTQRSVTVSLPQLRHRNSRTCCNN